MFASHCEATTGDFVVESPFLGAGSKSHRLHPLANISFVSIVCSISAPYSFAFLIMEQTL